MPTTNGKLLGDKEKQEKLLEKSIKFQNLGSNLAAQNSLDTHDVVHEIREEPESSFFNILKGDDQDYPNFDNRNSDEESKKEEDEENFVVRRSRRRTNRMSFADLNENGHIEMDHNDTGDEYSLIKCKPYCQNTSPQPLVVYLSFQSFLQMSIHAHLFSYEIIGFVVGHPFKTKNGDEAMFIEEAYAVESDENITTDRYKSVEMNPTAMSLAIGVANSRGQKI